MKITMTHTISVDSTTHKEINEQLREGWTLVREVYLRGQDRYHNWLLCIFEKEVD